MCGRSSSCHLLQPAEAARRKGCWLFKNSVFHTLFKGLSGVQQGTIQLLVQGVLFCSHKPTS